MTTTPTQEMAGQIAQVLVQARLAACVQILAPMVSYYRWNNQVNSEQEWPILIKTRTTLVQKVEQEIRVNHSYQVPEIIQVPVEWGSTDYLAWCSEQTISVG